MYKILIIDDEQRIANMISDFFKANGHQTIVAYDGHVGFSLFETETPDLIILDIKLPNTDGFTLCRRIRKVSAVPIIILTCLNTLEDQLFGYEQKADDYVTKPFNPEVLVAKAEAILARIATTQSNARPGQEVLFQYGGICLRVEQRSVTVEDQPIELEPKQFDILHLLLMNRNNVLTREQILRTIWKYNYLGNIRVVDTQITKLRKKLGAKAQMLETVSGMGYRFRYKP